MCLVIKGSWHVTWTSSSSFLFVQASGVPTALCAKMRNFVQFVLWYFFSSLEPSRFVDILKDIFLEVFLMCQLVWKTKIMWLIEVKSHGCTIFLKLKKTKHVLLIIKHSGCDLSAHTDTHSSVSSKRREQMVSDDAAWRSSSHGFWLQWATQSWFFKPIDASEAAYNHFKRYIFKELIMSTNRLDSVLKNKLEYKSSNKNIIVFRRPIGQKLQFCFQTQQA